MINIKKKTQVSETWDNLKRSNIAVSVKRIEDNDIHIV